LPVFETQQEEEVSTALTSMGFEVKPEQVKQIDQAELKVIQSVDFIDVKLAEDLIDVLDGEITIEEIDSLIQDENFDELPDEAINVIVDALNETSDDIKEEFEDNVNIFGDDNYDDYVPAGSVVDTATRRTVVAVTAATAAATGAAAGPKPSGGSGGGGGGSEGPKRRSRGGRR
jgi:hypothetical protein